MKAGATGLPITLDLDGRKVVLVGAPDDPETARKRALLADAGAQVTESARFVPAALDGARLVMLADRDPAQAAIVFAAAQARGVLCWCADQPACSDLAMPAIARVGAARFAISTSGRSPTLASALRAAIEQALGDGFARFVDALGELRERVQKDEPDPARRRAALAQAIDGFRLELAARYPDWFAP
jgi:siroheme synthase-like protein